MPFQQQSILWRPVIAVAIVQGAITLMWVVYNLYIPLLLKDLGLNPSLGLMLLAIESLLGCVVEPFAGTMNDRTLRAVGVEFPIVLGGAMASTVLFILIPWVALWGLSAEVVKGVFIALLLVWAMAMAMFRAPIQSLLGRYAANPQLPRAASAMTIAGGIAQIASAPSQKEMLMTVGPYWTFGVSGVVLAIAIGGLYAAGPMQSITKAAPNRPSQGMDLGRVGVLVFLGLAIALGSTMIRKLLLPQPSMELGLSVFMVANLVAMLPAGWVAMRVGNVRCLVSALVAAIVMVIVMVSPLSMLWELAWVGLGVAMAFVFNAVIPIAIAQATPNRTGFALGAYLGGVSVAGVFVNVLTLSIGPLPLLGSAGLGVLALVSAIVCVWRLYPQPWARG
jgi:MFS family permease